MHYLLFVWDILSLLGSIATVFIAAGLLTGHLELRRTRRAPEPPRSIVVHEAVDAKAVAAEVARLQTLSGEAR